MTRKANYKYRIDFKFKSTGQTAYHITGYVPSGLKLTDIKKYIQGQATDKKITHITILTQRHYYPEVDPVGPNGEIDVDDNELYLAQAELTKKQAEEMRKAQIENKEAQDEDNTITSGEDNLGEQPNVE